MFKKVIQSSLLKPNPGTLADGKKKATVYLLTTKKKKKNFLTVSKIVVCSEFISCTSCIAQEGCGYCANIAKCVSGGWFGTLDKSCGLNDYYYHQCHSN